MKNKDLEVNPYDGTSQNGISWLLYLHPQTPLGLHSRLGDNRGWGVYSIGEV